MQSFDVIVVGAGPGGSAAAKRCAQNGLKVLLLDKQRLPRHKTCAGWLLGSFSKQVVTQEFGEVPRSILNDPPYLAGFMFHTPDGARAKVDGNVPQAWREDLDYWMTQQAVEAGAQLWDEARVADVAESDGRCSVRLERNGVEQEISAKFIIGADGSLSLVRRCIFPELEVPAKQVVEQWFKYTLRDIEREYSHDFLYRDLAHNSVGAFPGSLFHLGHKEEFFYIGMTTFSGRWQENMRKAKDVLAQHHGFDSTQEPAWIDGCMIPMLHKDLIEGSFRPALGNIALVGDAAGLLDAVSAGHGIGGAVYSGALAADSILQSCRKGGALAGYYWQALQPEIAEIGKMRAAMASLGRIEEQAGASWLQTAMMFAQEAMR